MATLEQSLKEVKGLHEDRFGHTVDEEFIDDDGIKWRVTRGAPPSFFSLLQSLNEAKRLYEEEYGVDYESEDELSDEA
mgnify:CR=1 FL=1